MAREIWVEYTENDAMVCARCENAVFLEDSITGKLKLFCDVKCMNNENGKCPKFKPMEGLNERGI